MEREEIGEWVKGRCGRENGEGRRGGEGGRRGWERELPPVFRGGGWMDAPVRPICILPPILTTNLRLILGATRLIRCIA